MRITEENEVCMPAGKQGQSMDDAQRLTGLIQEYLTEARNAEAVYIRGGGESEFQYSQWRERIMEAALCAERLTERLRRLVMSARFPVQEQVAYRSRLVQSHEIQILYEKDILRVEMPFLLAHRKTLYTDYIYKPLYLALLQWCETRLETGEQIPSYEQATLCYVHMYNKSLSAFRVRDHDNMEQKQVADALGMFFLVSDGGLYMDTYHTTVMGEKDRTILFLMPVDRFGEWIHERKRWQMGIEK